MIFPHPVSLEEAIHNRTAQAILPTSLRSEAISQWPRAIRARSVFSAGVQNAQFLGQVKDSLSEITAGRSNLATQRVALKSLADRLGLEELTKDSRLNLILRTQTGMMEGFGSFIEGQSPEVLDMWPCQELYRAEERKEPRDWPDRWEEAGGTLYPGDGGYSEGRMIAAKDDPIWFDISEFGLPYAPFDYNSGMDLRDVSRAEAIELGVIEDDDEETPDKMGVNEGLEQSTGLADDALTAVLELFLGGIARIGGDGIAKFIGPGSN